SFTEHGPPSRVGRRSRGSAELRTRSGDVARSARAAQLVRAAAERLVRPSLHRGALARAGRAADRARGRVRFLARTADRCARLTSLLASAARRLALKGG